MADYSALRDAASAAYDADIVAYFGDIEWMEDFYELWLGSKDVDAFAEFMQPEPPVAAPAQAPAQAQQEPQAAGGGA